MLFNYKIFNNSFSCRIIFFIVAFYVGLWSIRIPTIKDQVETDYLGIGYILASYALGSVILMVLANKIIKSFSSKTIIKNGAYFYAFLWILVPFITNIYIFVLISFFAGCVLGIYEIAMNLQASDIEKKNNKSMMSGFHAYFSLGLLIGALITSTFIEFNISFLNNVIAVVIFLLPLNIIAANGLGKDMKQDDKERKKNIFFSWPAILIILVIITVTDSFAEGSIDAWGALYMRDYILAKGFTIGFAAIFFNIFMVIGRLLGDRIRDALGIFNFLLISIIFCILASIIIFSFNSVFSSVVGFSLFGIGISNIIPLAYSISGKIPNVESAVGITVISISAYGIFMIAPAIEGVIANYFGISYIFLPMIFMFLFCLIILIFSKKLFI